MPSWLRESTAAFLPVSVQKVIDTYIVGDENSTFYLTFWSVMLGKRRSGRSFRRLGGSQGESDGRIRLALDL